MPVPFIDLKRFEDDFSARWATKCEEISRNTMFVGGPEAVRLEERLRDRSGAASVVGCANGTDALQLALRAVGVGPGDVVLLPDATFWATFEAVVNVGAHPVTVDIDMRDLQLDYDLFLEAVETHKPKAVMITHLYGWASARLSEFRAFCQQNALPLVEDGAQAFDVEINGESIFKGAHVATISFYPAKVLGACGDAGAVYCSTEEMGNIIRQLGNHGRSTHYGHTLVGWNSRMGGFDAAYLNLCLDYIDDRIASRRAVTARYREAFTRHGICHVGPPAGQLENGYLSVALVDAEKRDAITAHLKEKGIGFGIVYPGSMSTQPGAAGFLHGKVGGERSDKLSQTVINLPVFAYMRDEEVEECINALVEGMKKAGALG